MNGHELAVQFRKLVPTAKILFSSGYTDDVITNRGAMNEDSNFISKPYTLPELARSVKSALKK